MALSLWGCRSSSAEPGATPPPAAPAVEQRGAAVYVPEGSPLRGKLVVQAVALQRIQRELSAPATVEADPARTAKIAPPLPGRVVKLHVRFGDSVKQGQPLFNLDAPELVAAQSDYLKARSAAAQADRNVARQTDLLEHGIGARRELEQAQTDRDAAHSELQRATLRLRLLGMDPGAVGGPLTVLSPLTGRVIDLNTAPGQYQNDPAAVLMTVADLSSVWVTASVQEKDIRRVHDGDQATAAFAAYPGEVFHGSVTHVGDLLDPQTRAIKIRVGFDNPQGRLKPGMFATVTFRGESVPEVVVPAPALLVGGERSTVYVEVAPWTFERRAVEPGGPHGDLVVINRGLVAGERAVVRDAVLLP